MIGGIQGASKKGVTTISCKGNHTFRESKRKKKKKKKKKEKKERKKKDKEKPKQKKQKTNHKE